MSYIVGFVQVEVESHLHLTLLVLFKMKFLQDFLKCCLAVTHSTYCLCQYLAEIVVCTWIQVSLKI